MKHGGDTLSYKELYEGEIIDFSSNINPLGYPKGLGQAIMDNMDKLTIYPDIKYRKLKSRIADYLGCSSQEVIVGNGAVDIIDTLSLLFDRVVVVTPCFVEYIERPQIMGKSVRKLPLKQDFSIDVEAFKDNIRSGDMLILGNPNNPTGRRIPKGTLLELYQIVTEKKAFLVLDEAFYEFCKEDYDSIALFRNRDNVCIIRAATKFYALPGIRLGYAFTSIQNVTRYETVSLPWSVNSFAEIAAGVIFGDDDYIKMSKQYIAEQREFLLDQLGSIDKIKAFATDSNFILIKLLSGTEEQVFDFLIGRGIMVRKASSFDGLDHSYIRVAIKACEDNRYLISCLSEYCKGK